MTAICPKCLEQAVFTRSSPFPLLLLSSFAPFPHPKDMLQCQECGELSRRENLEELINAEA